MEHCNFHVGTFNFEVKVLVYTKMKTTMKLIHHAQLELQHASWQKHAWLCILEIQICASNSYAGPLPHFMSYAQCGIVLTLLEEQ